MAENLNYNVVGSKCYAEGVNGVPVDSIAKNCAIYGRLYTWATAQSVCPSGWHLPSLDDFDVLMKYVDPSCGGNGGICLTEAGTKLKATSGWNSYNGVPVGTDDYGFSALPGGYGVSDGRFFDVGNRGYWWSSSNRNTDINNCTWYKRMDYDNEKVFQPCMLSINGALLSVRCVKN